MAKIAKTTPNLQICTVIWLRVKIKLLAVTGWWAPYSVMDWILQNTDDIDLENPGHVITGMELVLASIGSIVGGIVLTLTAVLAFRYYRMKNNAYPHTNRPLPKTPI